MHHVGEQNLDRISPMEEKWHSIDCASGKNQVLRVLNGFELI